MITNQSFLVPGGAGFLGTNLCLKLLKLGNHVTAFDNFYTGSKKNLEVLRPFKNFAFEYGDIRSPVEALELPLYDYIVNLACPASPPHYQKDPIYTTTTSAMGSLTCLEISKENMATVFLASTSEVYGDPTESPQTEEYRGNVNPIGIRACYDEGKRCAESLFFDYHRQHKTKIKVARIFNTYGPFMDPNDGRVVSNFIVQALSGKSLTIHGDGTQTRSFCYVDDLVDGIIAMFASNDQVTGPINLGNPHEFSLLELISTLEDVLGKTLKIDFKPLPFDDPRQRCPDITKAKNLLNWAPHVELREGLTKTAAYFESILATTKNTTQHLSL